MSVLCFTVLGPTCEIPDQAVMVAEINQAFIVKMQESLIDILSRFGCRESPTPQNLR